jgi:3-hydroxyacyl-[acyl-carrier-protein] dehydratase
MMDAAAIQRVLPHRHPFLLVDRVVEIEPGTRIRAYKNVSANEPFFAGHFPGNPIVPGVLILEALAQAGGLLAHATEPFDAARQALYLVGLDGVRFRHPVRPGDRLDLEVVIVKRRGGLWRQRGAASVDGQVAAEAVLLSIVGAVEVEDAR